MATFYKEVRRKSGILMGADGAPIGGKWSFDDENRNKLPKNIIAPKPPKINETKHTKILKPIIEKISNDKLNKIDCYYHDIEIQPNEPTKYSIRGLPTVLLFKGGKLLATKVGATSEKDLLEFINPHI